MLNDPIKWSKLCNKPDSIYRVDLLKKVHFHLYRELFGQIEDKIFIPMVWFENVSSLVMRQIVVPPEYILVTIICTNF